MFLELLREWTYGPLKINLYATEHTDGIHERPTVGYELFDGGQLIVRGADLGVPPTESVDSLETIHSLIIFLTTPHEDDGYSEFHREWIESDAAKEINHLV